MSRIPFRDLPFISRLMTAASPFMAWVLVAEFVVDRHGLDAYLPYYRYGAFCVYDAAVIAAIVLFWIGVHRGSG